MTKYIHIEKFHPKAFREFDGSEVVVTPSMVLFWKPPNPFGQWTKSPFFVDGVHYSCAEQYMMAGKAALFGDEETRRRILETDDPKLHKKLGKQVVGFSEADWTRERGDIVFKGNIAKFSQNQNLYNLLIETGERSLVEASPLDRIWGIGLAADHPDAYVSKKWQGLNLLGQVLCRVRSELKSR